ncbi:MAG: hypothetical protein MMC23_007966 [Stictis urceolatum]|nr:hypothetical protein [Stictis urceolata]
MVLLEHGAEPYLKDASGSTPLHHALVEGSLSIVKTLMEHGAYLWELDGYHRNALQLAFRSRSLALIDYMLDLIEEQEGRFKKNPRSRRSETSGGIDESSEGHDVDESSASRSSILYSYIKDLRTMGADINAHDRYSCTPLHAAVKNNNRAAVEAFLSFPEVQHSMRDNHDCTPLDHSVVQEQIRMTEVLQTHHANHSLDFKEKLKPIYTAVKEGDLAKYDLRFWALTVQSYEDRRRQEPADYEDWRRRTQAEGYRLPSPSPGLYPGSSDYSASGYPPPPANQRTAYDSYNEAYTPSSADYLQAQWSSPSASKQSHSPSHFASHSPGPIPAHNENLNLPSRPRKERCSSPQSRRNFDRLKDGAKEKSQCRQQ